MTNAGLPPPRGGLTANGWFPAVGLVLAAWASLPPYVGPALDTASRAEVADHVVPAVVMVAACLVAVTAQATHRASPTLSLLCGLLVAMAGLWMTLTHLPLIAQANRDQVPWGSVIHHTAPCVAVLVFGVCWTWVSWASAPVHDGTGR